MLPAPLAQFLSGLDEALARERLRLHRVRPLGDRAALGAGPWWLRALEALPEGWLSTVTVGGPATARSVSTDDAPPVVREPRPGAVTQPAPAPEQRPVARGRAALAFVVTVGLCATTRPLADLVRGQRSRARGKPRFAWRRFDPERGVPKH